MKTTVLVESRTRNELKRIGHKGDSYDEIIMGLIESSKKSKNGED
jgi:hypothetical protein